MACRRRRHARSWGGGDCPSFCSSDNISSGGSHNGVRCNFNIDGGARDGTCYTHASFNARRARRGLGGRGGAGDTSINCAQHLCAQHLYGNRSSSCACSVIAYFKLNTRCGGGACRSSDTWRFIGGGAPSCDARQRCARRGSTGSSSWRRAPAVREARQQQQLAPAVREAQQQQQLAPAVREPEAQQQQQLVCAVQTFSWRRLRQRSFLRVHARRNLHPCLPAPAFLPARRVRAMACTIMAAPVPAPSSRHSCALRAAARAMATRLLHQRQRPQRC
ncbi:hypothetical protein JKP88DRAFT_244017 [Tribonema minus]|uniref:Uncharacterized protein n=1 Tax=Tribonema minus TaxID=303371 RepID=A0A835ZD78_9STRA|nr:hypothetical protein JKP88DRAFT_244017 [Tribonema minus]